MTFAFIFESVGGGEWLVLLAVILVVVGPKNLPSAARKVGSVMSKLRRAADEFKRQIMTMDQEIQRAADDMVKTDYVDKPADDSTAATSDDSASDGTRYGDYDPEAYGDYNPEDYSNYDPEAERMEAASSDSVDENAVPAADAPAADAPDAPDAPVAEPVAAVEPAQATDEVKTA